MSSARDICHLYRRAAFGPRLEDVNRGLRQGYEATVRALLDFESEPCVTEAPPPTTIVPPGFTLTLLEAGLVVRWWMRTMVATRRPLEEKLTLFWHGHFTTSIDPVFSAGLLLRQNQLLREHAAGRFGDMLSAVARDAAMMFYLDGVRNHKSHPNENFAREVMELFTLGIGHYTEHDVREAARAFTGWSLAFPDASFVFHPEDHDDGPKRFLGQVGCFDGDDILRILATHPQTARHICGKLYRWLADTDPSPTELEHLAQLYLRHHGHIKPIVEAILLSASFRGQANAPSGYRSPVEFVVAALRALDGQFDDLRWIEPLQLMGQLPFVPPNVKGWPGGDSWINTASLLDRINFAHRVAAACQPPVAGTTPSRTATALLRALGMLDASPALRRVLAATYERQPDVRLLTELALASPDFQVR